MVMPTIVFGDFYNKKIQYFQKIYILKLEELIQNLRWLGIMIFWKRFAKFQKLVSLNIKFACHRKSENQLTVIKIIIKEIGKNNVLSIFFIPSIYFVINLLSIS